MLTSFQEYMDIDFSANIDCTNNGKCSECGDCCSNRLPMSQKEINQIKIYIKEHGIKEQTESNNVLAIKTIDLQCPFLSRTQTKERCMIYPVRPLVCREYMCNCGEVFQPSKELRNGKYINRDVRREFYGSGSLN